MRTFAYGLVYNQFRNEIIVRSTAKFGGKFSAIGGEVSNKYHEEFLYELFEDKLNIRLRDDWEEFLIYNNEVIHDEGIDQNLIRFFRNTSDNLEDFDKLSEIGESCAIVNFKLQVPTVFVYNMRWIIPFSLDVNIRPPVAVSSSYTGESRNAKET